MKWTLLLPREHGAWGMMLQPFVAGAILGRTGSWFLIPALIAVMTAFIMREPLLVLARQRYVWRDLHTETADAKFLAGLEIFGLALCAGLLLLRIPIPAFAAIGSCAAALTITAVWMALRNRQRSVTLQSLSAFGLGLSAVLAGFAASGTWANWMLPLCLLHGLNSLTGIFLVHTRLDTMAAARNPQKLGAQATAMRRKTVLLQGVTLAVAAILVAAGQWKLALPVCLTVAVAAIELRRLRQPDAIKEPLRKVGWRSLAFAVVNTSLVVAVLWSF